MKTDKDHTIISWKAPEFLHYKKNQWWFPILAVITLALATLFVLTKQYIVAIIVILGASIMYRLAHQEPEVLPVIFSADGIKCRGQFFPFRRLKRFWIVETSEVKQLYLEQIDRFSVPVVIPLVAQDIEKIRDFLRHYLPEVEEVQEGLADKLNRLLKI